MNDILKYTDINEKNPKVFSAQRSHGSMLLIKMGEKIQKNIKNRSIEAGNYSISIYNCAWRIEKNKKIITSSSEKKEKIDEKIKILNDIKIIKLKFYTENYDSLFLFEKNIRIRTFSCAYQEIEDDSIEWTIKTKINKNEKTLYISKYNGAHITIHDEDTDEKIFEMNKK